MTDKNTREIQYSESISLAEKYGFARLGLMSNQTWIEDPSRLIFVLSRYKFVSRLFKDYENVLEIGCADAFAARIVAQKVANLTAVDFDPVFINDADKLWVDYLVKKPKFLVHDILQGVVPSGPFDGIYSLDVLEHIDPKNEDIFMSNVMKNLRKDGQLIVGMPSLESQVYASPRSREGHINCKTAEGLSAFMKKYFYVCNIFCMNDEVVHTGYPKMSHYFFAVCSGIKI